MHYETTVKLSDTMTLGDVDACVEIIQGVAHPKVDLAKRTLAVRFELGAGEEPHVFGYWLARTIDYIDQELSGYGLRRLPDPEWATDLP